MHNDSSCSLSHIHNFKCNQTQLYDSEFAFWEPDALSARSRILGILTTPTSSFSGFWGIDPYGLAYHPSVQKLDDAMKELELNWVILCSFTVQEMDR